MKIGDVSKTPLIRPIRKQRAGKLSKARSAASADKTVIAGVPEAELTPRVRQALFSLMTEVQELRAELAQTRDRLDELEKLADRDPLLDILNRRAFVRELDRILAMASRYDVQSCLVFIDMNDLKQINDQRGHAAGDAALKHVASALSANIRQTDIAGRLGGDEFGLLLTHVGHETAEEKAAGLAELVSKTPVAYNGASYTVEISFGVVPITKGASAEHAMELADSAMYEAKRRK